MEGAKVSCEPVCLVYLVHLVYLVNQVHLVNMVFGFYSGFDSSGFSKNSFVLF
jgi:hypothetical protein